jgi:glycosyltransferase involved in cell wall biosynthesis
VSPEHEEPIRVLRVIARLNVGGPAQHVAFLSRELDRRGYRTTLAAGQVGEGEGSMEDMVRQLGVEPVFVPSLQREISLLSDLAAVWHLVRLIRTERPRILHTHTAKAGAIGRSAALLSGRARPTAVVHTFHGHVLRGYFGPVASRVFTWVERVLGRFSDALVAVSPEVRDELVRMGIAPAEKIEVIRLGLDLERRVAVPPGAREEMRDRLGVAADQIAIGWLGRMTEIKRVDELLHVFAELRRRGVDGVLVLVGSGPLRRELEVLADSLGVAGRCRFVGFSDDVAPYYAAFDLVVLSSANEGTPVTLIEALAAGKPVVSTAVGGVRDVVEDDRAGFLVPPGDVTAFAGAVETLARDAELRRRFAEQGRSVLERYSVPRLVDDVDTLYRSLLEAAAPRALPAPPGAAKPLPLSLRNVHGRVRALPPPRRTLRVILLSQYFPPEVGATQSRMQAFAEYLAARGHQVTVICEFPNHPQGVIPPEYRGRLVEDDRSNDYRVLRVWVRAREAKTQVNRIAFYLSYTGMAMALAPRAGRADVVLASSPPLFSGIAGSAIAAMNRAPFVLDVRDLWPAAAVSLGQISSGPALRLAQRLERRLYRDAAAVVAVTGPFCDHIDAIRRRAPRTALIPNGTLDLFLDGSGPPDRLGVPPDRFLVTFAGTHGIAQALPAVLSAAEQLRDEQVAFVFVGDGPMKQSLVREALDRGLDNVFFRPQIPLESIPPVLAASDALLVPLSAHPVFADFVPSKMVDFMAAGRPVLLAAHGESARILEAARGGIVSSPEDPAELAEAVRWLAAHSEERAAMGVRGREFARKRLRSVQSERLEQVLLDVVGR